MGGPPPIPPGGPLAKTASRPLRLAVLGVERELEPDGLALRGRARAPAGGELLDQVQAPAALVGRTGGAQPRQPQIGVECLHPDRLRAAPEAERELAGPGG